MRKFVTFALVVLSVSASFADDIRIRSQRPSRLLAFFANTLIPVGTEGTQRVKVGKFVGDGSLFPKGVTLIAHDAIGVLSIVGPPELMDETKRYISLFDVSPRRVRVTSEIFCKVDIQDSVSNNIAFNNRSLDTYDNPTGIGLTITPRVNDDNTITFYVTVRRDGQTEKAVVRVKNGDSVLIHLTNKIEFILGEGQAKSLASMQKPLPDKPLSSAADLSEPEAFVRLRFEIQDDEQVPVNKPVPPKQRDK